jgi:tetratricopeptide (TPR) repeat protein
MSGGREAVFFTDRNVPDIVPFWHSFFDYYSTDPAVGSEILAVKSGKPQGQHPNSGLAHYNLQEYKDAIADFEAAYRLKPDPVFLYNLAQAHRLPDSLERALYFYRAFLRASPSAPNRREVEERITTLERAIAEKIEVAKPPDHTLPPVEPKE